MPGTKIKSLDIKLVNCAGCGQRLLGQSMAYLRRGYMTAEYRKLPMMRGRIDGRPYCETCIFKR